jgi:hypothetical protein
MPAIFPGSQLPNSRQFLTPTGRSITPGYRRKTSKRYGEDSRRLKSKRGSNPKPVADRRDDAVQRRRQSWPSGQDWTPECSADGGPERSDGTRRGAPSNTVRAAPSISEGVRREAPNNPSVGKLSALLLSCIAQKAGGLASLPNPARRHAPRPCFSRSAIRLRVRASLTSYRYTSPTPVRVTRDL